MVGTIGITERLETRRRKVKKRAIKRGKKIRKTLKKRGTALSGRR